jgi:hypothetical protein
MELEILLNQQKYSLPANNISGKPFISFFEDTMGEYLSDLIKSPDLLNGIHVQLLDYLDLYNAVEHLVKKITETIKLNLSNKIGYDDFVKTMNDTPILKSNFGSSSFAINRNNVLYRSKFFDTTDLKNQDYFFHTPFHLNDKVKSTRFSSSGIPSLYLSNSLVLGYLETKADSLNKFQSVKFQTKMSETFLDLDFTRPDATLKKNDISKFEEQLQTKALLFPLLFACYTLNKANDSAAPQEYIIPQMLTKWISESNKLYAGIRYPTTKIGAKNLNYEGKFYNYILPVIQYENEGFCPVLKNKLNISDVCSNFIHNIEILDFYKKEFNNYVKVNNEINSIEWGTTKFNYDISDIGKMEFYLKNKLITQKINF